MRIVAICAMLCAYGAERTPAPLLFDSPDPSSERAVIDLAAIDAGSFRFKLGERTITPHLTRSPLPNGMLVQGIFGINGSVVLARVGTTVTGIVRDGNEGFEIVPVEGGHRVMPRSWRAAPRSLHGPGWHEGEAVRGTPPTAPASKQPVVIDVLFAYTARVLDDRTVDGIWGHAQVAIADLNTASAAAGAAVTFRVANVVKTNDTENGEDIYPIYYALLHKTRFKDAHAARKTAHADILVLLVDKVDGGLGLATIMGTPETAVAVVDHHDSLWNLTIPHEIGHIMGGLHDDDMRKEPFPYGHAYVGTNGRTILSNACPVPAECPLKVRWSGPKDFGDKKLRDVARVIRETAGTVSRFGDNL